MSDFIYDCEDGEKVYFRDKYSGKEISFPKKNADDIKFAMERYQDLCEYFQNNKEVISTILHNRTEFKNWLNRMRWHVKKAEELDKELTDLKKAAENIEKRYRGKCEVTFLDGRTMTSEIVVKASNIDSAKKICQIEFRGDYAQNPRVKNFNIIPCSEDHTPRPSAQFVMDNLLIVNDVNNSDIVRQNAKEQLYSTFRRYQPAWDDDTLFDVLTECNEGVLEENHDVHYIANELLEELDGNWCCWSGVIS